MLRGSMLQFHLLLKIGIEKVSVYLGSWGEWGNRSGLPVE